MYFITTCRHYLPIEMTLHALLLNAVATTIK